jgi:uncharacterized protein YjbI with pentapeptide repeats
LLRDIVDSAELLRRYNSGERDFLQLNLSRIRLRDAELQGINCSGADFSNADLSGANLSNADLSRVNLSQANLCATNLDSANCQDADFRNAGLTGDCHGINTNYIRADFRGNALDQGIVEKSDFTAANFEGCHISQYSFIGCNLTAANFRNTRLSEVIFENCNLTGADFSGAFLDFSFKNSLLDSVSFRKATLDICNKDRLKEIDQGNNIDFTRTVFYFGRYSQLLLPNSVDASKVIVIRYNSDLSGMDLSECNLEYLDLSDMNLTDANLNRAKLPEDYEAY